MHLSHSADPAWSARLSCGATFKTHKSVSRSSLTLLPVACAACAHSPTTSRRISSVLENDQADGAAVDAMRRVLSSIDVRGRVIIGEGEKDEAPMLYCGEEVRPSRFID